MSDPPATPECKRLADVAGTSQEIGEFIEWLGTRGLHICALDGESYWPTNTSINRLLADFYRINLDVVERERRAVLNWMREKEPDGTSTDT